MRPFTVTLFQNTPISLTPLYLQLISKKEKFGFRSPRALIDAQTKGVPKMSSLSQIAANRSNAQFCTGPTTQAGKKSCKMNALRHGLTSKQIVLPHEDREGFERLLTSHRREYDPASPTEEDLIQELAISQWSLLRARRVESEYFAQVFESSSGTTLAALIASGDDQGFQKIQRYLAAAERAWRRALKDLQVQSARRKMQKKEAREHPFETIGCAVAVSGSNLGAATTSPLRDNDLACLVGVPKYRSRHRSAMELGTGGRGSERHSKI